MAFLSEVKYAVGTPIVLAGSGYSGTMGAATDAITLASLVGDGTAGRQSAAFDFGALRAPRWNLSGELEFQDTPANGSTVEYYLAFSNSISGPWGGGVTGTDIGYTGQGAAGLDNSLKSLTRIGIWTITNISTTTGVQRKWSIGQFEPTERYASLVIVQRSGIGLVATNTNHAIVLSPLETQTHDQN